jgi:hypothetical protein
MHIAHAVGVAAAGLAVAGAATGITYAATSSTGGSVRACANSNGTLRLLSANGQCPKHYRKVSINERGPRGPIGKTGPRGRAGHPGAPGPGALSLVVHATTPGTVTKVSPTIGGSGLTVEVVCVPEQEAQVYINLDNPGSVFTFEGAGSFTGTGAGTASWLKESDDSVVTTTLSPTPVILSAEQSGTPHSVEFTTTNGSLAGDVLVTRGNHVFSVQFGAFRDSTNTCWSHALVTPAG